MSDGKRPRKLWINSRRKMRKQDHSFNSYTEMPAVDAEREGFDMYVDGALYAMALKIIVDNAKICTDKEVASNLTTGLVELSEF